MKEETLGVKERGASNFCLEDREAPLVEENKEWPSKIPRRSKGKAS